MQSSHLRFDFDSVRHDFYATQTQTASSCDLAMTSSCLLRKRHRFHKIWTRKLSAGRCCDNPQCRLCCRTTVVDLQLSNTRRMADSLLFQVGSYLWPTHNRKTRLFSSVASPVASGVNIYSFFSDIQHNYSRYPKKNSWYLKCILYIQNTVT